MATCELLQVFALRLVRDNTFFAANFSILQIAVSDD